MSVQSKGQLNVRFWLKYENKSINQMSNLGAISLSQIGRRKLKP